MKSLAVAMRDSTNAAITEIVRQARRPGDDGIISHDPGYLRDHCNRWAVLDRGRMTGVLRIFDAAR